MVCPYCGKCMQTGIISGDRYPLKWVPENDYSFLFSVFQKGIKLTDYYQGNNVEAHFCEECHKIIINVSEEHLGKH